MFDFFKKLFSSELDETPVQENPPPTVVELPAGGGVPSKETVPPSKQKDKTDVARQRMSEPPQLRRAA